MKILATKLSATTVVVDILGGGTMSYANDYMTSPTENPYEVRREAWDSRPKLSFVSVSAMKETHERFYEWVRQTLNEAAERDGVYPTTPPPLSEGRVRIRWSGRLTASAGICKIVSSGYSCQILLSQQILLPLPEGTREEAVAKTFAHEICHAAYHDDNDGYSCFTLNDHNSPAWMWEMSCLGLGPYENQFHAYGTVARRNGRNFRRREIVCYETTNGKLVLARILKKNPKTATCTAIAWCKMEDGQSAVWEHPDWLCPVKPHYYNLTGEDQIENVLIENNVPDPPPWVWD